MGIQYSTARIGRALTIRVKPGTDLIEGIEEACRLEGIRNGAITSCIGSLDKATFMFLVPEENKVGAVYCAPVIMEGPVEILSTQGTIGLEEDGALFVHLHGAFCSRNGRVQGGHLVRSENRVLFTAEVLICEAEGPPMLRQYDPEVELKVLMPVAKGQKKA